MSTNTKRDLLDYLLNQSPFLYYLVYFVLLTNSIALIIFFIWSCIFPDTFLNYLKHIDYFRFLKICIQVWALFQSLNILSLAIKVLKIKPNKQLPNPPQ